jgi:hypothetical protein
MLSADNDSLFMCSRLCTVQDAPRGELRERENVKRHLVACYNASFILSPILARISGYRIHTHVCMTQQSLCIHSLVGHIGNFHRTKSESG